jgi:hypothetical protein
VSTSAVPVLEVGEVGPQIAGQRRTYEDIMREALAWPVRSDEAPDAAEAH